MCDCLQLQSKGYIKDECGLLPKNLLTRFNLFVNMKLAIIILFVGVVGLSSAAPHQVATKQDKLARLESLLGKAFRYASGFFAKQQDDDGDDDLEDLLAEVQDGDDDDDDDLANLIAKLQDGDDDDEDAKLESFWKKALGHGLRYASSLFHQKAKQQDDDDDDDLEDLLAEVQDGDDDDDDLANLIAKLQDGDDDDDDDDDAKLESFWKKALGHGLRYASGLFAKQQDGDDDDDDLEDLLAEVQDGDDDDDDLANLIAKLQDGDDDDDDDDAKLESFWKKALGHGLKYASTFFHKNQATIENLMAKLQDGDDNDLDAKLQSFWKKALGHGLKYASGFFAKQQMQDGRQKSRLAEELLEKLTSKK